MDFIPESTTVTSSSYSCGDDGSCMLTYHKTIQSSEEEEEDMANCLIMLAQSVSPAQEDITCQKTKKLKIRSVTEMAAGANSGFHSYECKTCNRAFPSFQALGGHRASHKKPKLNVDDYDQLQPQPQPQQQQQLLGHVYEENKIKTNNNNNKPPSPTTHDFIHKNSKVKVHECSICGSEFLSGQALGGHMRRHRTAPPSVSSTKGKVLPEVMTTTSSMMRKSHGLSLDLNLPPPEVVDDGHSTFQFGASSSHQPLVFSAAALVDCHY